MNKNEKLIREIEKYDILLILIAAISGFLLIDFFDWNEKFGFPISAVDEPLLVILGIIFGYFVAKLHFLRVLRKIFR